MRRSGETRSRATHTRGTGRSIARIARLSRCVLVAGATVVTALASAVPAQAAALPTVSTGGARNVSYGSAILTGSVDPDGSDTSYYFQYGPTKSYGGQTTIADAGAGTSSLSISLPVAGLEPLTVYHYRLVAVNGYGAASGDDGSFLTAKVPLTLAVSSTPDPVLFGGTVTVQGTLSGTGNGEREVVLQAEQFPFTAGFQNVGNPELTTPAGGFSFPIVGLELAAQYRVVTTTDPPVVSAAVVENVAVRVDSHVARTRRRHFARIYGVVTPAENGMQVGILNVTHGRGVLVAGTVLRPLDATSSSFSRVVPVRAGVYRVLVRVTSGAQTSAYSAPLRIG